MLTRDFHIQGAELRGLFLAQLPQRLARLSSRGERLHREGWDINTLYLFADDAQVLSVACRDLAADELADCLEALSATVRPLFDPPRVPDGAISARITTLLGELADMQLPMAAQVTASHAEVVVPGPAQEQGFPLLVTPPAEYWLRFAGVTLLRTPAAEESLAADADAGAIAATPAPAVAEPIAVSETPAPIEAVPARPRAISRKTAYHLGRGEAPAGDIDRYLATQSYELTRFDRADELKELLVALPPHLVIVDAAFESALDEIGALVKRARAEVSERIWLVALSNDGELQARLRAVRAGCDAFIALPASLRASAR